MSTDSLTAETHSALSSLALIGWKIVCSVDRSHQLLSNSTAEKARLYLLHISATQYALTHFRILIFYKPALLSNKPHLHLTTALQKCTMTGPTLFAASSPDNDPDCVDVDIPYQSA